MITTSSMLQDIVFDDQKPVFKVLLNTKQTREIRILLSKGQQMKKHSAPSQIVVEVFSGSIDFGVQDQVHLLKTGDLIAVPGRVPHNLLAHEDSVLRLTLSKGDTEERLAKVIADSTTDISDN